MFTRIRCSATLVAMPISLAVLIAAAAPALASPLYENSGHSMTAGSFGVAFINASNGDVMINSGGLNGVTKKLLSGVNATHVMAANLDGSGGDELIYIHGGSLYYYNFATQTTQGGYGGGIIDVSATSIDGSSTDTAFVPTGSGIYRFNYPGPGFTAMSGSASAIFAGDFDTSNPGNEFIVRNSSGAGYFYNPDGTGAGTATGGSGIVEVVGGNLYDNDAAWEGLVNNTSNGLYIHSGIGGGFAGPVGDGTNLAVADLEGNGRDEVYYLSGGSVYVTDNGVAGSILSVGGNSGFSEILGVGGTLYAIRANQPGEIYGLQASSAAFSLVVPEPSTFLLSGLALLGLVFCGRRRRR